MGTLLNAASLINRILVAFVPMLLVLIPGLKLLPAAYRWRKQLQIYRWYRALLKLEREVAEKPTAIASYFSMKLSRMCLRVSVERQAR